MDGQQLQTLTTNESGSIVVPVTSEGGADIELKAQVVPGGPNGPSEVLTIDVDPATVSPETLQLQLGDEAPRVGETLNAFAEVTVTGGDLATNTDVVFQLQPGGTTVTATTDTNGRARAELQLPQQSGTVEVLASVGGLVARQSVDVQPLEAATVTLRSFPETIGPDQQATVRAAVRDANGNPVPGTDVRLESDGNGRFEVSQLETTLTTNANGIATANVRSVTTASINLSAQVVPGGPQGSAVVTVDEDVLEIASINLSLTGETPRVGGDLELAANVERMDGGPAIGVEVAFALKPTGATTQATTESSGRAVATLALPTQSGQVSVVASVGGVSTSQTIDVQPQAADALDLQAFPSTIAPNETTSVRAIVRDANGNPIPGADVRFETNDEGQIGQGQSQTVTTDGGGAALVEVSSITQASITVSAQVVPEGPQANLSITVQDTTLDRIVLLTSSVHLPSSTRAVEDGIELTAIATDADNRVVQNVDIDFSSSPDGTLQVTQPTTDQNGRASAVLTTPDSAMNRTLTLTASGGGVQAEQTVDVVGTRLEVMGPEAIRPDATEVFDLRLTDAVGEGISQQSIDITSANGNVVSPGSVTTDATGRASITVTAGVPGQDVLSFQGFGLIQQAMFLTSRFNIEFLTPDDAVEVGFGDPVNVSVEVTEDGIPTVNQPIAFSATRGRVSTLNTQTDAQGRASVNLATQSSDGAGPVLLTVSGPEDVVRERRIELISDTPSAITLQAEPATLSRDEEAVLTAAVRDPDGNPVRDQTVRFSLEDTSAGELRSGLVTTDGQGVARTTYIPGNSGSGTEAVIVTASVGDPEIDQDQVALTVRSAPLFIVLGSDNQISKNGGDATYSKIYNAIVTDAAGNPPPESTDLRLSLRSLEYQKGEYERGLERWIRPDANIVPSTDAFFGTLNPVPGTMYGPYFGEGPFGCRSEDPQGTGNLDLADDYNGNDAIDPPAVGSTPASASIDDNGVASFELRWAQSVAQWVLVRLTVTARVDGTESSRSIDFTLPVAAEDINDLDVTPPNQVSPFGTELDCANPG